jgi:hypothetical protein
MNTVTPTSWPDLIEELFSNSLNNKLDRHRSPYGFRGMTVESYKLQTSLMRLNHSFEKVAKIEARLLDSFRKYAHSFFDEKHSNWHWISLAQHHGLPTRLLDWSFSPFVALHFATDDLSKMDHNGVVWCVNFEETHRYLPEGLRQHFEGERRSSLPIEVLAKDFPDFKQFDDPDKNDTFVLFFEPPSLDQRIVNQVALFSFTSRADMKLDEWLEAESVHYPKISKRVIIPAGLKWEVRDKLDQTGITERVLFPGLDGLSTWLKRWYTPKVSGSSNARITPDHKPNTHPGTGPERGG